MISVPVSDQERAKNFHVERLGFEPRLDSDAGPGGSRWIMLGVPAQETVITLVTWFKEMPAGSLRGLVLGTNDIEGLYQRLSDAGAEVTSEIETEPWGRNFTLRDSEGNSLVIRQPL